MNCPNCNERMEREDHLEALGDNKTDSRLTVNPIKLTPSALYYCNNCGSEYKWIKGQALETIFDSVRGSGSKDEYFDSFFGEDEEE